MTSPRVGPRIGCRVFGERRSLAAQQGLAADNEQRAPIGPWYRPGGGPRCSSVGGQRCSLQLKHGPLGSMTFTGEG